MRFLVKFILLVSVRKDIDFFSMYDEGFLLIRTNSLEGALAYLKGGAPIDAVLLETGVNNQRTRDLCIAIRKCNPRVNIVLLSDPDTAVPDSISADVVVDKSYTDIQLADALTHAVVEPPVGGSWAQGSHALSVTNARAIHS